MCVVLCSQALACWQWANFLGALRPVDKRLVHVNMDETCMKMWLPARRGYVQLPAGDAKRHCLEQEQRAELGKRRSALSLIAFASDDMEVQKALPQVLIGNSHVLPAHVLAQLGGPLRPNNMFIFRRRSSWADADLLVQIFRLVGKCLEHVLPECHVLFSMDASPVHLSPKVVKAAAIAGLHLHFIPAKMTPWLQPLDAYIFSCLKARVRQKHDRALLESETGEVTTLQMCELICAAVEEVLQSTSWARAFRGCGFAAERQSDLGGRVGRRLDWPHGPPTSSTALPSLEQLQKNCITGKQIPIGWLFHLITKTEEDTVPAAAEPFACAEAHDSKPAHSWSGRLRSSSHVHFPEHHTTCAAETSSSHAAASSSAPPLASPCPPPPAPPVPLHLLPKLGRLGPPSRQRT